MRESQAGKGRTQERFCGRVSERIRPRNARYNYKRMSCMRILTVNNPTSDTVLSKCLTATVNCTLQTALPRQEQQRVVFAGAGRLLTGAGCEIASFVSSHTFYPLRCSAIVFHFSSGASSNREKSSSPRRPPCITDFLGDDGYVG